MAAWETFASFKASLTEREQASLKARLSTMRSDLLAARSEDARLRLVEDLVREMREIVSPVKK